MDRSFGKLLILLVLIPLLIFPGILSIQSEQLTEYSYNDHKKDQEFKQFQNSLPSLSLTPHNSIFIDSDDDFINYNFIGNGSKVNPYIIENYLINSTIKNYGIVIKFTSKFFVIRNCFIGKCNKACILIENVEEGTATIFNNTCRGFFILDSMISQSHGIFVKDSPNSTIDQNNCNWNTKFGIYILSSPNSTITNSFVYLDDYGGVYVKESQNCIITNSISQEGIKVISSSNCLIKNNTCTENEGGIYLENSDFCELLDNNIKGTYEFGIYLNKSRAVSFTGNLVDGTIFLDNVTESSIKSNMINKLILKKCQNNTIADNLLLSAELYSSSQITIQNNTNCLESKEYKVYTWLYISRCHHLNILKNICQKVYCAIFAKHSSFLKISSNNLTENYGTNLVDKEIMDFKWFIFGGSIEMFNSTNSSIVENDLTEGLNGVHLVQSGDNLVANNSIKSFDYGVYSFRSNYNNITDNIIKSNFFGIDIDFSNYESIKNNTIKGNKFGIYVDESNYCDITYNAIDKNEIGIAFIEQCIKNKITNNIIKENAVGIYLNFETKDNILHHNYFFNNSQQAIDDSGKNTWYELSTEEGNYWSDHNKKKPYEIAGDGEAIDPYPLNENLERIKRAQFLNIYFVILSLISLIAMKKRRREKHG